MIHNYSVIPSVIWFCNCKKTTRYIRVNHNWMNSPVNISPTFIFLTFPGHLGRHSLEKCPAQDATSEGAFQRCRLFHLDSSVFRYSWPLGQRSEYLRSQRHGAAHWLPRNKCLSCVNGVLPFQGLEHPHIRADKIQQDQILGCFGPSKIVKVILMFEQPFNDLMVWLRASRIRLRFEMAWVPPQPYMPH